MHVDEDAAGGAFGDDAFVGDEIDVLGTDEAGDDFGEGAKLFVGVAGFDGNVEMNAGGAGSFEEGFELQLFELFQKRAGDGDADGEFGAIGRIEIEEEIVGMLEIGVAAGPGIVVDAAEAGEEEKSREVVGGGVVNVLAFFFGGDGNRFEPVRDSFAHIFLEEGLTFDAVGIAAEHQRTVL